MVIIEMTGIIGYRIVSALDVRPCIVVLLDSAHFRTDPYRSVHKLE